MHPGGQTKTNHIEADRLIGYRSDYTIGTPNDYSIIPRGLCDTRYALKTEIPVLTPTKIYDVNLTAIVESATSSQPQLILRAGSENFMNFQRISSGISKITTNPALQLKSNAVISDYTLSLNTTAHAMSIAVVEADQTATLTCKSSQIKFNDSATNTISFTGRPGLTPSAFNVTTNDNSFLTKAETAVLYGPGTGGSQTSLVSSDQSFISISSPGTAVV